MIVVLLAGIVVASTPTVAVLELDVGSTSGDLHQAASGSGRTTVGPSQTATGASEQHVIGLLLFG